MSRRPGGDDSRGEGRDDEAFGAAVAAYLAATAPPPFDPTAVRRRATRLARRRLWTPAAAGAVAAALVAAVVGGGRALAPRPPAPTASTPAAFASTAAPAAGAANAPTALNGRTGLGATRPGLAPTPTVVWRGRRYALVAPLAARARVGRRLEGASSLPLFGPPAAAAVRAATPTPGTPFHPIAVYALRGQRPTNAIAVYGRFGDGPPALWLARLLPPPTAAPNRP
jgi:hypothetical protein